jgi:acyl carrier protein
LHAEHLDASSREGISNTGSGVGERCAAPGDGVIDAPELRRHLSQSLPDYMIPAYFVFIDSIPLNANGKVNRSALPMPGASAAGIEYASPRNKIEEKLLEIWSEVLQVNQESIGIDGNFFEMGGHSLKAVQLVNKIHKEFAVDIEMKEIFTNPTIHGLALRLKNSGGKEYNEIASSEKREYYDLSYGQRRLWILNRLAKESSAYNLSLSAVYPGKFYTAAFKKAVQTLVDCHGSLRTGFRTVEDEPVQFVAEDIRGSIREVDISSLSQEERSEKRNRIYEEVVKTSFDLSRPPLFRVVLLKLTEMQFEWMFCLHHIITDGWSMEILKRNFIRFYETYSRGEEVNPVPMRIQYKDFATWHNKWIGSKAGKQESHLFWKEKLAGGFTPVELPVDFPGYEGNPQGAGYRSLLDEDTKNRLKKIAIQHNTTLFVVMFSVYILMLFRFSKQEDISCSIIGAGREHISFYEVIGFFVNSILFKIKAGDQEHFSGFLSRVHAEVLACFKHQSYPIELVCNDLKIKNPDLPVSFNMLNIGAAGIKQELEYFQPHHVEDVQDVKFVIELYVTEYDNGIDLNWRYMKGAFEPETIAYIIGEYLNMVEFFSINREKTITDFYGRSRRRVLGRKKKESENSVNKEV